MLQPPLNPPLAAATLIDTGSDDSIADWTQERTAEEQKRRKLENKLRVSRLSNYFHHAQDTFDNVLRSWWLYSGFRVVGGWPHVFCTQN